MDRKPVYSKDHSRRVISVANGLWQLQRFQSGKELPPPSKTHDPWERCGPDTSREEALMAMGV